jgi:hypothetical protein
VDLSHLRTQSSSWNYPECFFTFANSAREAIEHFRFGDFDLMLLGESIPDKSRERLAFLLRASGSHVPVVCVTDSPEGCGSFSDATFTRDPRDILRGIEELSARLNHPRAAKDLTFGNVH